MRWYHHASRELTIISCGYSDISQYCGVYFYKKILIEYGSRIPRSDEIGRKYSWISEYSCVNMHNTKNILRISEAHFLEKTKYWALENNYFHSYEREHLIMWDIQVITNILSLPTFMQHFILMRDSGMSQFTSEILFQSAYITGWDHLDLDVIC